MTNRQEAQAQIEAWKKLEKEARAQVQDAWDPAIYGPVFR